MSEKSWSKWSSVAEILSSTAILITLVFLVVQTKQNTDAINAQLVANRGEARAAIWEQVTAGLVLETENPRIQMNLRSVGDLSEEEQTELQTYLILLWGTREFVWLQYRDGVVDEATYKTIMDERHLFTLPRVSEWWDERAATFYDPEFVELINSQYRD